MRKTIPELSVVSGATITEVIERLSAIVAREKAVLIPVRNNQEWITALDRFFPLLALLDLDHDDDWEGGLTRAQLRPHTRYVPVIAYSRHNLPALRVAAEIGAERTCTTQDLLNELESIVRDKIHPPVEYPFGWDEPLPTLAEEGLREFNRGAFFEQHELLEEAWRAEKRPIRELYQGILQVGVAFYQIELGNWHGAIKTFRRGLPKLRKLPPICQGIDLDQFLAAVESIHREVSQLDRARLSEFDKTRFPQIKYETRKTR